MSYILDALKKSEQERGQGNIPDVQTVHSSNLNYRNEKKAYWPYFLIVAVLLNLLAIVYFIIDKQADKDSQILNSQALKSQAIETEQTEIINNKLPNKSESIAQATNVISSEEIKPAHEEKNIGKQNTEKANTEVKAEKKPTTETSQNIVTEKEQPAQPQNKQILSYYELPESIKNSLPSFIISAHVYSSNPMQRSIVINNNFLEENEYVLDDLILHEITPDGAIFNYQGTLFSYDIVSGWQ